MSNVIDVLEQLGAHPAQAGMATQAAGLDAKQRDALLAGDREMLAALVGTRAVLVCSIAAPENDPDEQSDEPLDEPTDAPDESGSRAA